MTKFKIKTSKAERVYYDAEHLRLSTGHWAIAWNWDKHEMADKKLQGLIESGRTFNKSDRGDTVFDLKLPNIVDIMQGSWDREKASYSVAARTHWGHLERYSRYWSVEYRATNGNMAYLNEEYAAMAEDFDAVIWLRDSESPVYVVGNDMVLAVIMPVKVPDKAHNE